MSHHPPENEKLNPYAWGIPCSQQFLDNLPHPIGIYRNDGFIVAANVRYAELFHADLKNVIGIYNILEDPAVETVLGGKTRHEQILRGEVVVPPPFPYGTADLDLELEERVMIWVQTTEFPIHNRDGDIEFRGIFIIDVSEQIRRQQEFEANRLAIVAQQEEIARQREIILELSTPVIQLWDGILTMPLIGVIDSRRAISIMEDVLEAITRYHAETLIIDITGVAVIDTAVAKHLILTVQACRLLGCEAMLVGISPQIAQTIVTLGLDMSR